MKPKTTNKNGTSSLILIIIGFILKVLCLTCAEFFLGVLGWMLCTR